MAKVYIPALLQEFTDGAGTVDIAMTPGKPCNVRELIAKLEEIFPGIAGRLLTEGRLVPGIAVFIDSEQNILGLRGKVAHDSEVHFIPPVAGGHDLPFHRTEDEPILSRRLAELVDSFSIGLPWQRLKLWSWTTRNPPARD